MITIADSVVHESHNTYELMQRAIERADTIRRDRINPIAIFTFDDNSRIEINCDTHARFVFDN
jgi:hypothetical protein